jgi:hypothetical protein
MEEIIDYQKAIDLTEEQEKAWKSLERAIKKCKKENIYFYQVLDSIGGLNGDNVLTIYDDCQKLISSHYKFNDDENCLNCTLDYPSISVVSGWADDCHYVRLKCE